MVMLYNLHHVANKAYVLGAILVLVFAVQFPGIVSAQEEGMSITITPPLFQLSLQPGESWSSAITVVNNNTYGLSLYADPVQFRPSGESGRPSFISNTIGNGPMSTVDDTTLAGWITVPKGVFPVNREQTYSLPVTIHVPEDATPGGHYAAVLIGNNAPESITEEGAVNVSSSVAALFFLTVSGDVTEAGRVREFSTQKSVYETAEAHFTLRFENQGNVHLLPQGNIVIYNMFGKERGFIPVNHDGNYGNVLPESIRNFNFTWESDSGLWDIGRYKAEVTIAYGRDSKQSALSTTYFYVLPVVPLLQVLAGLFFLITFITWAMKRYIRRALMLEERHLQRAHPQQPPHLGVPQQNSRVRMGTLVEPIKEGFVDLRGARSGQAVSTSHTPETEPSQINESFVRKYKGFFIFLLLAFMAWLGLTVDFNDVMTEQREYDVAEIRGDGSFEPIRFDE